MKKLSSFLVGLALTAGTVLAADTNTATSVNAVGFVNVNLQSNVWKLLCMPFDKMDNTVPSVGDVLDPSGSGLPNGLTVLFWDGTKYVNEDYYAGYGFYPNTNSLIRGVGIWVRCQSNITISICGQVPTTNLTTTALAPGYNLISFPYPASMPISNTVLQVVGSVGDSILRATPTGYENADFYLGYGWYPGDFMLNPGEGYWYRSQAGSSTNWNQTKPYIWP